jgi:hypothetical protein
MNEVATGLVTGGHYRRRRRVDFLHFMNRIVAPYPDQEMHVILESGRSDVDEKPHIQALERAQGWLKLPNGKALTEFSHNYQRHGTTTLFAALARQVRDQIDAFIAGYNQDAQPFEWTQQVVFSQHPRSKYANLGN